MKKLLYILLPVFIVLPLSLFFMTSYTDNNGSSDFSLETLTDQDIIQGTGTTTIMTSKVTTNNKTVCKARTISGVAVLFEKNLENDTLNMVVSCEITKGNARLVLVIDDKIVHDFVINEENQHFALHNVTGKVCLKLAGESAGYSVTYKLQSH